MRKSIRYRRSPSGRNRGTVSIRTTLQAGSKPAGRKPRQKGAQTGPEQAAHAPLALLPAPELSQPRGVAQALEAWFAAHARDLPWRRARSGYAALVSEVMLQQTQVARVVPAFERFMARFPTPAALAAAPEQEVLAAWQGLGYYRRARLLHAAAKAVVSQHNGQVPHSAAALQQLPGVGRYTAGAVASIVHGACEPIVDGNVFRVLARLTAHSAQPEDRAAQAWAWEQATRLVQAAPNPGATNEALMELGATVCTPGAPQCHACPLRAGCKAAAAGDPTHWPAPKRAAARRAVHWHAVVCVHRGSVVLEQRGSTGLWAHMWQPPALELAGGESATAAAVAAWWGAPVQALGEFEHTTSHRQVRFQVWQGQWHQASLAPSRALVAWDHLHTYPLANAAWRVLQCAGAPVSPPPSAGRSKRAGRAARSAATDS